MKRKVALLQGAYFALTGLWAVVHIESFMRVTGPKTDVWLVKTVGALVIAIGAPLIWAAKKGEVGFELALLAALSAFGLAAIELHYALNGAISAVYLMDFALEAVFFSYWSAQLASAGISQKA